METTKKMTNSELAARLTEICSFTNEQELDDLRPQFVKLGDVFKYAAWCEYNFERNLRENYKRKTTFTSDFSIAEWCVPFEGKKALTDTLKNAIQGWKSNYEYMAELVIALNLKSWEHNARGNNKYSALYAELYHFALGLYFDLFEGNDKATQYYFDYVD